MCPKIALHVASCLFIYEENFFAWDSFVILYDCFLEMRRNMPKKVDSLTPTYLCDFKAQN